MDIEGAVPSFISNSVQVNQMTGKIDVYYAAPSPICRALIMLAKALNIKFNLKPVDLLAGEQMTPEYLRMNPQHSVPTMVEEDGFTLWESRAIMKYLVDQYSKDSLYFPQDPKQAAMVNQRLYFDATVLFPRLVDYYFPVVAQGQMPDVSKKLRYEEALAWLDGFLENSTWVAGQQMTIADFSIVANISTADAVDIDISNYGKLSAWYDRTKEALSQYGYEEINQEGADIIGKLFKSKLK